jgi:hypothetical protein
VITPRAGALASSCVQTRTVRSPKQASRSITNAPFESTQRVRGRGLPSPPRRSVPRTVIQCSILSRSPTRTFSRFPTVKESSTGADTAKLYPVTE